MAKSKSAPKAFDPNAYTVERIPIDDIKPAPYNPRVIDEKTLEKLTASIKRFGYVEPIIVNKQTSHVVGGNQRLKVMQNLGVIEVNAITVDLTLQEEKALNLALNKISGSWDFDALAGIFRELEDAEFDTSFTGFEDFEVEAMLSTDDEFEFDFGEEDSEANIDSETGLPIPVDMVGADGKVVNATFLVEIPFSSVELAESFLTFLNLPPKEIKFVGKTKIVRGELVTEQILPFLEGGYTLGTMIDELPLAEDYEEFVPVDECEDGYEE